MNQTKPISHLNHLPIHIAGLDSTIVSGRWGQEMLDFIDILFELNWDAEKRVMLNKWNLDLS